MSKLTLEERKKVKKPMLWIAMGSILMTFAGLTSGYVVSRSSLLESNMWLEFALPNEFYYATVAIVLSSISLIWAKRSAKRNNFSNLKTALWVTFALGIAFAALQYAGWQSLIDQGLYFTGPNSNTATSWVYIISFLHWLHVLSGLIVLMVTLWRAHKNAYSSADHYGLDMSAIYWHFLDVLWIYLFLFLSFIR